MSEALLEEMLAARRSRTPCAVVTVAAIKGSVPRAAGAKMLVYAAGEISGTIGGGKFEALVVADAQQSLRDGATVLKSYPMHENDPNSFGAICGGEVTVLIEPQHLSTALFLVGGGHCSRAIAKLGVECGMHVTVVEERADLAADFPAAAQCVSAPAPQFIASNSWRGDEALLLVSRNHQLDQEALAAALTIPHLAYIGMIGSRRKVRHVFDALRGAGVAEAALDAVYAPIGLDIGADSPAEIAISVLAEVLQLLRRRPGTHLRG
ncbi:MAG: XdhC/CoxI family protein [Verrucomicrobiota bacterium]|nr:XdhC/CoxI family protein [Verrucomicrobiota bacterium]